MLPAEDSLGRSECAYLTFEEISIFFKVNIDVIAELASVKRGLKFLVSWDRLEINWLSRGQDMLVTKL